MRAEIRNVNMLQVQTDNNISQIKTQVISAVDKEGAGGDRCVKETRVGGRAGAVHAGPVIKQFQCCGCCG